MPSLKHLPLLFFASVVLLLPACRKDVPTDPAPPTQGPGEPITDTTATGVLVLRLVPEWEGQPFQPFVEHHNVSGYRVQVEKVRFYLGDIRLQSNGTTRQLSPVEIVDFGNGPVEFNYPVSSGSWNRLAMALGVPYDLNHSDPALYANDHPLSVSNAMHWTWTDGYIFTKFEGRYDLDPAGSGPFPLVYSIHTGFDTAYTEMSFDPLLPFALQADDTTTITLRVAVDRFFHSDAGGTIDLATENMSHGMNVPLSLKLTRNVVASFALD
jgi:hypothetical protein